MTQQKTSTLYKFIDIAKLYYKKTGKELSFVPMYIAPEAEEDLLG